MILGKVDLRRHHHRRLGGQLRFFIPHHDLRRGDLLHRRLGQITLGRRYRIMISTAAAAAHYFLRYLQCGDIRRWRDEHHRFTRLDLFYDLMSEGRDTEKKTQKNNVHNHRSNHSV